MNNFISSSDNDLVKKIRKLSKKKYRKEYGQFVIESRKLLEEALETGADIDMLVYREDVERLDGDGGYRILEKSVFDQLSQMVNPDGYMAIVNKDKEIKELSNRILILDRIQDPGNMGTMIRSAEAFGFETILMINCVDIYNEKVVRASMGSLFRLNFIEADPSDIGNLQGYRLYAADMGGVSYQSVDFYEKTALVIGNEARGIDKKILEKVDQVVSIPMRGQIESLNAAVSASILMARIDLLAR